MNRTLYLDFYAPITEENVNTFMQVINGQIIEKSPESIYLLLSSSGGSVVAGITMYNFILSLRRKVEFTIHNIGAVDSIANVVFMSGHKRYASKTSTFLFHGITWNLNQGAYTLNQLREFANQTEASNRQITSIISDNSSLTETELLSLFIQGESKDVDFAIEKGIIHEIKDVDIPDDAFHYSIVLQR